MELNEQTGELAYGPERSLETIALSSNFPVVEGQINANGIEVLIEDDLTSPKLRFSIDQRRDVVHGFPFH